MALSHLSPLTPSSTAVTKSPLAGTTHPKSSAWITAQRSRSTTLLSFANWHPVIATILTRHYSIDGEPCFCHVPFCRSYDYNGIILTLQDQCSSSPAGRDLPG